jgi:hypothetical protein
MLSRDLDRYYEPLRLLPAAAALSLPYTQRSVVSPPPQTRSPALGNKSSRTCHPCYPGSRLTPLPLFQRPSNGLPLLTTGSASLHNLRGYVWVQFHYGLLLLFGNSRPRVTTTPLPHATGAYGQLPRRDFKPLDLLLLLRTVRSLLLPKARGKTWPYMTCGYGRLSVWRQAG